MCAITGWAGKLPKGVLTQLLINAEERGRDSTGVAFRLEGRNKSFKSAVSATEFVNEKENQNFLGHARRSLRGMAHTRRASAGMPINDDNAHPFLYWHVLFAHNGKVQNWKEIKAFLIEHFQNSLAKVKAASPENEELIKTHEFCLRYSTKITTDSMVLGPYIISRNFSSIVGCMGLVWMHMSNLYCMRVAKEATSANIIWRYRDDVDPKVLDKDADFQDHMVTLVASTREIILKSFERLKTIEFDVVEKDIEEGRVYKVDPTGIVDEGAVPINATHIEDKFSSEVVKTETKVEEAADDESTEIVAAAEAPPVEAATEAV